MIAVSRQIQDHVLLYLIASTTTKSPRDAKSLSTVDALETETTSPLRGSVRKLAGMYCARDGIAEQIQFTLGWRRILMTVVHSECF